MNGNKASQQTEKAAYGAALLFGIHLVTYFIPSIRDVTINSSVIEAEALALLAVAEHLILFPVVATLPAPNWGRAVGYGWLVLDIATDIMQLNGADKLTYLTLRYGANIAAALSPPVFNSSVQSGSSSSPDGHGSAVNWTAEAHRACWCSRATCETRFR